MTGTKAANLSAAFILPNYPVIVAETVSPQAPDYTKEVCDEAARNFEVTAEVSGVTKQDSGETAEGCETAPQFLRETPESCGVAPKFFVDTEKGSAIYYFPYSTRGRFYTIFLA